MKVAVTGATGFLGRHVLRELATRPDIQVVAACRNPDPALQSPSCKVVSLDIAAPSSTQYHELGSPDVLIHLAWSGLPNYQSMHHFEAHLGEQYRFLASLVEAGLASMLCAGTCLEYGMKCGELQEELTPDPRNPYALAKDALRRAISFLRERSSFALTWVRLFYMYGSGQAPTSLYSQLNAAIARADRHFAMSLGHQLRDYLPVTEVARVIVALAVERSDCGIVNVCSGVPQAVRAMVERWLAEKEYKMDLVLGRYPLPSYEPLAFWGSRKKLEQILGATR